MAPFRALLLDLGEVLVLPQPPDLVRRMAEVAAAPLAAFTAAYWAHRPAYDFHGSHRRFWGQVLDECRSSLGGAAREAATGELLELDIRSWTVYREEVWKIAADFRARGGKLAVLSNGVTEILDRVRAQRRLDRTFDAVVVSCEVGCLKPDPAIFRIALERLGVEAEDSLFVDDRAVNVAGAEAIGMHALHFVGDASVPALRARLGQAG
ncbi:MAG TPA: HAD family phosphatase [Anaeromyxobacter sp.]|nr:HAD family phosphatase [Anaeromyxobacter sp.]